MQGYNRAFMLGTCKRSFSFLKLKDSAVVHYVSAAVRLGVVMKKVLFLVAVASILFRSFVLAVCVAFLRPHTR